MARIALTNGDLRPNKAFLLHDMDNNISPPVPCIRIPILNITFLVVFG
ncbi:MAG: hypothetical protein H0W85_01275 [Methylotenera sp.]|nr:hypothetical protein [Methylotenera sp.]